MPPVGFESTIAAGERPQTYALDRAATGTGSVDYYYYYYADKLFLLSIQTATFGIDPRPFG